MHPVTADRFDDTSASGGEVQDPVERAVRRIAASLTQWGSVVGDVMPAFMFWVTSRSTERGVMLSLAEPTGFDSDVLTGLRGLTAPPEALGAALSVPAPLQLPAPPGSPHNPDVVSARMSVVLLRDGTAAATVTAPGLPCRFTRMPPDPVGGFLRRVVGLPSQLAGSVSLADVAARHLVSVRCATAAGGRFDCDPELTPAGVAAAVAVAGGGWVDVLAALANPEVVAPDAPSAELVLCAGAAGGGWADVGVVAHDLDALVPSWARLGSRWSALRFEPCTFADAQLAAFTLLY